MQRIGATFFHVIWPPFLFLPVGMLFAPDGRLDATRVPWILLVTQVLLAVCTTWLVRRGGLSADDLGLGRAALRPAWIYGGLALGALLAGSYEVALGPALDWLRANVGDVIPPGETRRALGAAIIPFAIANVALAPFIEEVLYRGVLERRWREWWGPRAAFVIGIIAFGLLHWAGGFFYIGATALVGALFLWVRRQSDSLHAAIAVHFSFNLCETSLALLRG